MSIHFRLSEHDRIDISGNAYRVHSQDEGAFSLRGAFDSELRLNLPHEEFFDCLSKGAVRIKRGALRRKVGSDLQRLADDLVSNLPKELRTLIFVRKHYSEGFLELERDGETARSLKRITAIIPSITAKVTKLIYRDLYPGRKPRADGSTNLPNPPSASTLLRWVKRYEDGDQCILALLPKYKCGSRWHVATSPLANAMLSELAEQYLCSKRPTQKSVIDNAIDVFTSTNRERLGRGEEPLPTPSRSAVRERIKELDPFEVHATRYSLEAAKKKFRLFETGLDVTEPLERVEIDEWEVDLISIFATSEMLKHLSPKEIAKLERGRRWLYVAIDCATRCIVGMRLAKSQNAEDAVRTLRDVTRDKSILAASIGCAGSWDQHGGIVEVCTDNGPAFTSQLFQKAVTDIDALSGLPPVGLPEFRAIIERHFRTLSVQFTQFFTGRTFGNPKERGDYDSVKFASLTDDSLMKALIWFVVDQYHNKPHYGLDGETPANCWKRLCSETPPLAPPDLPTQLAVFGLEVSRKITGGNATVLRIPYTCSALRNHYLRNRAREVTVRVDPENLNAVAIKIGASWELAHPLIDGLAGVSVMEWRNAAAEVRRRHMKQSAISLPAVMESVNRMKKLATDAERLAHVIPNAITASDIERAENELFLGLTDFSPLEETHTGEADESNNTSFPTGGLEERTYPPSSTEDPSLSAEQSSLRITKVERGLK